MAVKSKGFYMLVYELEEITTKRELRKFINKNEERMDSYHWYLVCKCPAFSVDIAEEYSELVDWEYISTFVPMKIAFMKKHFDKLNMYSVSRFQPLTLNFIKEKKDSLSMRKIMQNEKVMALPESDAIRKMYIKMKKTKKYQKIWDAVDENTKIFRRPTKRASTTPIRSSKESETEGIQIEVEEIPEVKVIDFDKMKKNDLKTYLKDKGVRVYYHDTIPMLREKVVQLQKEGS